MCYVLVRTFTHISRDNFTGGTPMVLAWYQQSNSVEINSNSITIQNKNIDIIDINSLSDAYMRQ